MLREEGGGVLRARHFAELDERFEKLVAFIDGLIDRFGLHNVVIP